MVARDSKKRLTRKPAYVNTVTSHCHSTRPILFAISELALPDQDTDGAEVSFIFTNENSLPTTETHDKGTKFYFTAIRLQLERFLRHVSH